MVSLIKRWEVLGGPNTLCSLTFLHKYIILTKALTGGKDLSFSYTQKILVISKAGEVIRGEVLPNGSTVSVTRGD